MGKALLNYHTEQFRQNREQVLRHMMVLPQPSLPLSYCFLKVVIFKKRSPQRTGVRNRM